MRQIAEWDAPSPDFFRDEIAAKGEPAVLRGAAAHWPLVRAAAAGADRWLAMLETHANEAPMQIIRAGPAEQGRFHYASDGKQLNFIRGQGTLAVYLVALRQAAREERPHAMAAQGMLGERYLPGFSR